MSKETLQAEMLRLLKEAIELGRMAKLSGNTEKAEYYKAREHAFMTAGIAVGEHLYEDSV